VPERTREAAQRARDRLAARGRLIVGTYHDAPAEAVQYRDEVEADVFEWAPGKWHFPPLRLDGGPAMRDGMTVWIRWNDNGRKAVAQHGDWIIHVLSPDMYHVTGQREMDRAFAPDLPTEEYRSTLDDPPHAGGVLTLDLEDVHLPE
jgi:hypothetical protein